MGLSGSSHMGPLLHAPVQPQLTGPIPSDDMRNSPESQMSEGPRHLALLQPSSDLLLSAGMSSPADSKLKALVASCRQLPMPPALKLDQLGKQQDRALLDLQGMCEGAGSSAICNPIFKGQAPQSDRASF